MTNTWDDPPSKIPTADIEELRKVAVSAEGPEGYEAARILDESRRKQVGGTHYAKHEVQPFDIIDMYGLNFYEGNVLKYLLRWRDKNGSEDLLKAKHYLEELIERVQGGICE
jgi:uncharacterized protein DUF3310